MKKFISLFTTFCIVLSILGTFTVFADDTTADLEISTLAELEAFRDDVNNGNTYEGKTVKLTADIDMSEKYGEGKESWVSIGTYEWETQKSFSGNFNGGGHKITNIYINGTGNGLFGCVLGTVKSLGVQAYIYTTFDNSEAAGGIVAELGGTIENCYFSGSIEGDSHIGGITGFTGSGQVINCYNTATVKGIHCIGGIVGTGEGITNCYNAGDIIKIETEWEDEFFGSITGGSYYGADINDCYYLEGTYNIGVAVEEGIDTTTALTMEQFADKSNFTNWDFDTVWEMDEALGRPVLRSNREEPPAVGYNIDYKDGNAVVTVAEEGTYTIIFVSYTEDRLLSINSQNKQFKKGKNEPIAPQNFNTNGNIKIMLWDSLEGMKPLAMTGLLSDTFIQ